MSKHTKTRLCWNCEGSIPVFEEMCHLCGVSVIPASLDSPAHLFTPPYHFETASEQTIPESGYQEVDEDDTVKEHEIEQSGSSFNRSLIAVTLLSAGSFFFLFSLAMMIFSQNGVFTLQWDGSWWFIYGGLSIPLLICGWCIMSKLDE